MIISNIFKKNNFIISVGSALVVLILLSIVLMSHLQMRQLSEYDKEQDFTFKVIQNLDNLIKLLREVRNEQRQFSRSREIMYFKSYDESLKEAKHELELLYDIASGRLWLQKRVVEIEIMVKNKLGEIDWQIKHDEDSYIPADGVKHDIRVKMSEIRELVTVTKNESISELRKITAKQQAKFNKIKNLLIANSIITGILIITILLLLKREVSNRIQLNKHVVLLVEQERLALSREVHDDIGQNLTALKLDLALIEKMLHSENSELASQIMVMSSNFDALLTKCHDITAKLRPPLLDNLGMTEAIEWQVDAFSRRSSIEFHLMLNEDIKFYKEHIALEIIRVLQEALTNVILHARATEVFISLFERGDKLILEISDNGCGITSKEVDSWNSYGIAGMRERASLCNGEIIIKGNPERGTIVTLLIPLLLFKESN